MASDPLGKRPCADRGAAGSSDGPGSAHFRPNKKMSSNAKALGLVFLNLLSLGESDLPRGVRDVLHSFAARVLAVGCIVYSVTGEVVTALAGSALFGLTVRSLLNPESALCLLPNSLRRMEDGNEEESPGDLYLRIRELSYPK